MPSPKQHTTDGTKCWCKQIVPVWFDGQKVGNATIDHTGGLSVAITSEQLAQKFAQSETKGLSISSVGEPEGPKVQLYGKF